MKKNKADLVYLNHILDEIYNIEKFLSEGTEGTLLLYALERSLEIIGEATKCISDVIKKAYPEVTWSYMARMRDKLIHHYFNINEDAIWDTTENDIPVLKEQIQKIIEEVS